MPIFLYSWEFFTIYQTLGDLDVHENSLKAFAFLKTYAAIWDASHSHKIFAKISSTLADFFAAILFDKENSHQAGQRASLRERKSEWARNMSVNDKNAYDVSSHSQAMLLMACYTLTIILKMKPTQIDNSDRLEKQILER